MTHDVKVTPLLFSAIRSGAWKELIVARQRQDFITGEYITFFEWDENGNRYTSSLPVTVRILAVSSHYADMSRIPHGFSLLSFEPVADAVNPPVQQYTPVAKDARLPMMRPRPRQPRWPL